MKKLISVFASLTFFRVLGAGTMFIATLLIAREFGAESLGSYSIILALASLLSVVFSLGFSSITAIRTAEFVAGEKEEKIGAFVRYARQNIFVIALVIGGGALVVYPFAPQLFQGLGLVELAMVFCAAVCIALTALYTTVLIGRDQQFAAMAPEALLKPILFVLALGVAALMGWQLNGSIIFGFAFLGIVATLAVLAFFVRKDLLGDHSGTPEEKKEWRNHAYPWTITTLVWDYFIEAHILIAGLLVAPAQVAILHVCFRLRVLAGFGMRTLSALLLPDIVGTKTRYGVEAAMGKVRRSTLISIAYGILVLVGFALIGDIIFAIFGPEFVGAKGILLLASSVILVRALFGPAPAILSIYGHQKDTALIMFLSLCLSVVGCFLLFEAHGILGIVASYAFANWLASMSLWIIARAKTGLDGSLLCLIWR